MLCDKPCMHIQFLDAMARRHRESLLDAPLRNLALCCCSVGIPAQKQDCRLCQILTTIDGPVVLQAASVGGIVLDTCKSVTLKGDATLTYQWDQYPYVQVDPADPSTRHLSMPSVLTAPCDAECLL